MTYGDFPKPDQPSTAKVEAVALAIWREREATFPRFTRRMAPDEIDRASGAWAAVVLWAIAAIGAADAFD